LQDVPGDYSIKVYWTDAQGIEHVTQDSAAGFNPDDYSGTIVRVESMGGGPASGAPRDSGGHYTIYSSSSGMYPKDEAEMPDRRIVKQQQTQAASGTAPWSGTQKSIDILSQQQYAETITQQQSEHKQRLFQLYASKPWTQYQTESGKIISRNEAIRNELKYGMQLRRQKQEVSEYPSYAEFRVISVDKKPVSITSYHAPVDMY